MEKKTATYHIIGSGVAGLFCARILKQKYPWIKTVVYEAADTPGGRCRSYRDDDFVRTLDCATHVILGANKEMGRFVKPDEWEKDCLFWNAKDENLSSKLLPFKNHILESCCNTKAEKIAPENVSCDFVVKAHGVVAHADCFGARHFFVDSSGKIGFYHTDLLTVLRQNPRHKNTLRIGHRVFGRFAI